MRKERKVIEVSKIDLNTGQLEWLPRNPRQWTADDVRRTVASIREDEDFLEDRPLLVVPNGERWVVFGGNMRREGCKGAKVKTAPCVEYIPESDEDRQTICRRAMKDNGSFGAWDFDVLANEWDDLPLTEWGVPTWDGDAVAAAGGEGVPGNLDAEPKNKPFVCKITFPDADAMTRFVAAYKDVLERDYNCTISESGGEL